MTERNKEEQIMRAKTKLTRLCGILLTLALLVGLLPTTALADSSLPTASADFTVNEATSTAALALLNAAKTDGAADSTWDGGTKTLTLNGVNFTTTASTALQLPDDAIIVLNGENTITGGDSNSSTCFGIYAWSNLTISGTGTLNVTAGSSTKSSIGIRADDNLTISGGTVTATGGTATGDSGRSSGIYAYYAVAISDSTVTATGGTATGAETDSYGIRTNRGDVTITGGTVEVTGGAAGHKSSGIYARRDDDGSGGYIGGNINISGGAEVTAAGGDVTDEKSLSYGLFANEAMTISDSAKVTATGGASSNRSYGIRVYGDNVTISGGAQVTATGGTAGKKSYGIGADDGNVTISGGAVKAKAGSAGNSGTAAALNEAPTLPTTTYWWRTSDSGIFAESTQSAYSWSSDHSYVEIQDTTPAYTVSFDANGGSSTMADDPGVYGSYTLPENGFTPPAGKQFKGWAESANGAVISGTSITVTADTTLYAIWENTKDLSRIDITTPPTKTTYTVGESFDTAGMVVTATYSDGSTAAVTGYTVSPSAALTTSDTSVMISYTEGGVTKTATQAITVNASTPTVPTTPTYTPPTYKVESTVSKDDDGSVSVSKASAKKGDTVTITVTPDRYYKTSGVIVKDASGRMIAVTDNGNGTFTFQMPDSKVTVEPVFSWDNPFVDVAGDAYYAPAVEWALKNDITNGTSATTFSPNAGCTRGQIVTFLWRAAGCPEPKSSVNPFTDVEEGAYYSKAVLWAVENGITDGTGDGTTFSPDLTCTRDQTVTFLWRAAGKPAVTADKSFADVSADAWYATAVAWAVENGITDGTGDGTTFSPADDCTRAQIVTFLYRYFVK